MAEYISMDCLWKCETCFHHRNGKCAPEVWCENGENYRPDYSALQFSAIEAEPVRHGRWIEAVRWIRTDGHKKSLRWMRCSACGFRAKPKFAKNYCPNCGAKMDKENEK